MSLSISLPNPVFPNLAQQGLQESIFTAHNNALGQRFGWRRGHSCPCSYATGTPGSPNPRCATCGGRGVYWDAPLDFKGLFSYMHTTSAPDEPGMTTRENSGSTIYGDPVLTVPHSGDYNEKVVWTFSTQFDAFVQYDSEIRFNSILTVSQDKSTNILPYQFGVKILAVTAYDATNNVVVPVPKGSWAYDQGIVILNNSYSEGTAFTVEYLACPIFVAYRESGGTPHVRPFAGGETNLPRRFHLQMLSTWLRSRAGGESPGYGVTPGLS